MFEPTALSTWPPNYTAFLKPEYLSCSLVSAVASDCGLGVGSSQRWFVKNCFPSLKEVTGPGGLAWRRGWVGLSGHWGTWHWKAQGLSLPQKPHIQHYAVSHSVLFISKNGASPLKATSSPRPLRAELCGVSPCPRRKELHFYPLLILEAFLREFSFGRSEGGSWMNAK